MHELSLATALVEQVTDLLMEEGASIVVSIRLQMGTLCGVEREAFSFCFPVAAKGSVLEDARLEIEEIAATVRCKDCGACSPAEFPLVRCAACGGIDVDIVTGRDFMLKSLEVQ